jgi:hypothetical protein
MTLESWRLRLRRASSGVDVYCGVVLAVAGAGESMASLVAAGGFDRGSTAVAGVVVPAGETGDVAAVSQDFRGEDGTEVVDVSQGAAGGFERRGQRLGVGLDGGVEPAEVGEQIPGQGFALLVSRSQRTDQAQQRGCPDRGQVALRASGVQTAQYVQPVQGPGAFGDLVVTVL